MCSHTHSRTQSLSLSHTHVMTQTYHSLSPSLFPSLPPSRSSSPFPPPSLLFSPVPSFIKKKKGYCKRRDFFEGTCLFTALSHTYVCVCVCVVVWCVCVYEGTCVFNASFALVNLGVSHIHLSPYSPLAIFTSHHIHLSPCRDRAAFHVSSCLIKRRLRVRALRVLRALLSM
jgi:hypothetical protein